MKTIIVIEDDPDVTALLQELLKDRDEVTTQFFSDSRKAVFEIETNAPSLIITDLMMPGLDGFQLCSYLKSNSRTKKIPIIAMTGYDSPDNRKKVFSSGIDDYIPKPFDLTDMIRKIGKFV
jgi:CheY-like chemotaxis protein